MRTGRRLADQFREHQLDIEKTAQMRQNQLRVILTFQIIPTTTWQKATLKNTVILFVCPPKYFICIVFIFSWNHCKSRGKMETMFTQNFWGQTLSIMEFLKVTCSRPILSPRKQRKPQKSRTKIHISAPLHSTTWIEKPSSLIQLFWPSTADITIRYTTTSITFKLGVDKLEQSGTTVYTEYCQNWDRKNLSEKS